MREKLSNKSHTKSRIAASILILGIIQLGVFNYLNPDLHETDTNIPVQTFTNIPPDTPGAFIHVGKTGGSTISTLLRNGCRLNVPKPCINPETEHPYIPDNDPNETSISKLTTYYHVGDFQNGIERRYNFYVVTARDPLDRLISAYLYQHPVHLMERNKRIKSKIKESPRFKELMEEHDTSGAKKFFHSKFDTHRSQQELQGVALSYECIQTLESFGQLLEGENEYDGQKSQIKLGLWRDKLTEKDCASVAKLIMIGNCYYLSHFNWNLQTIMKSMNVDMNVDTSTILVIRTEHLNQDWISANHFLGQEGDVTVPTYAFHNATNANQPIIEALSTKAKKNLCLALAKEYETYMRLLSRAKNLSREQVSESLRYSRRNCHWLSLTLP